MNKAIIIGAVVLVLLAFIVGSSKGSKDEREEIANENGAIEFLRYKPLSYLKGYISYLGANPLPSGKKWLSPILHIDGTSGYLVAKDIYDAKDAFNDDETLAYSALSRLHSLADLADIQILFQQFKKENIFDYMRSFLNEKELTRCAKVLQSLPIMVSRTNQKIKIMQP